MSNKKGIKVLETYVPALEGGQVLSHSKTVLIWSHMLQRFTPGSPAPSPTIPLFYIRKTHHLKQTLDSSAHNQELVM